MYDGAAKGSLVVQFSNSEAVKSLLVVIARIVNISNVIAVLALLSFLCLSANASARWKDNDLEWTLKRDRNGIQVYLAKMPGSKFRAILSTMEVDVPPQELAALVMDLENCPNWAAMCKSAEVVEQISPSESYVRSVNDAPFPVRDRDVVAKVEWFYDRDSGKIFMHSDATPQKIPKQKGLVRVNVASSEWHFTPQENGKVLVENYAHIDPNGKIPAWILNLMIVESPYKTLKNMRELALTGRYKGVELAFIKDSL